MLKEFSLKQEGKTLEFKENTLSLQGLQALLPKVKKRLRRFAGTTKTENIDSQDLKVPLSLALDPIIAFIKRHTSTAGKVRSLRRTNIPEYPTLVIREAVLNALVHTDYSMKGAHISIAIFDDRIEIKNPGALPFGLTLDAALQGTSLLRNRVVGHVFRELELIEQWGSGLGRMIEICEQEGIERPRFEEVGNFFLVTLYPTIELKKTIKKNSSKKHDPVLAYAEKQGGVSAKQAQALWKVTPRTTSTRLKKMCLKGILTELATSPYDPYKVFGIAKSSRSSQ